MAFVHWDRQLYAAATFKPGGAGGAPHTGGAISLTSTGSGATASSVTAVANLSAQMWAKGRARVNAIRALGNSAVWELLYIDAGGTTGKLEAYITSTGTGGPYTLSVRGTGLGTIPTPTVTSAQLPANGQDFIWGIGWDQTNLAQYAYLFDGLGNTITSISHSASDGNLSTGNGFVTVNGGTGAFGAPAACIMDGVAIYTGQPPASGNALWTTKPTAGDSNIVYLCLMNDAQSGTSPATSVAAVGTTGLTWTAAQFAYTTDVTSGNWG